MDTGITNITRSISPVQPELDLKKQPSAADKQINVDVSVATEGNIDKNRKTSENAGVDQDRKQAVDARDLDDMIEQINEAMQNENRSIQFKLDEDSGRTVISIMDVKTGEQIKQIPAEELLRISRQLAEQFDQEDVSGMLLTGQV